MYKVEKDEDDSINSAELIFLCFHFYFTNGIVTSQLLLTMTKYSQASNSSAEKRGCQ